MKKILLVLGALAAIMPAQAQIMKSTTLTTRPVKTDITWYVRAGLSFNNFAGGPMSDFKKLINESKKVIDMSAGFGAQTGYDFEFGFQKPFSSLDFYWGMQLGFGTRGGHFKGEGVEEDRYYTDEWNGVLKMDAYTFKFTPIQIGYKYSLTDDIKIDGHIGAFLSIDMAGSLKEKYESYLYYPNDPIPEFESYEEKYGYDDDDDDFEMKRFDAGLQLGIGIWYKKFNLDFTWQRGFCDMWRGTETISDKWFKSSNAILSIGYAF